ncbi:MAG: carboxypeptidase-like regulatory domain-containing protein [Chitinophagaceae bacterium]|nr:carboxypeptidase-like regulatory domain-containing protein [Chitinophagaceae bacterium]
MRRVLPVIFLFFLLLPAFSFCQMLQGRVLNEGGAAAPGVSLHFKSKLNHITTNADGTFKIMATKLPDTLVFSAVGIEPYAVIITEKNIKDPDFEVVLLNKRVELSEVVVVSYGTAKKKDMTGAVSSVKGEAFVAGEGYLEGKAAGLYVKSERSGASVRIRGTSSMAKSAYSEMPGKPLYIGDTGIYTRANNPARSRILTAGEVNDFNKWKMWEDYTENEFRAMSVQWGLKPKKRYSVQLTDRQKNAVINGAVYLVSKTTGDTIWKAFTDNTGKAELWAGFFSDSTIDENVFIADERGNRVSNPSVFTNGVNLLVADRPCNVSADVDIAFEVDATGSMSDEIEFLKLELEDVIRNTMEKYQSLSLKAASVFYRDKGDEYLAKYVPFHDDLLKTLNFIKLQSAAGGGDGPEAVDDALSMALDSLHWNSNARTRLLFLVLDAPPHNDAKEKMQRLIVKAAAKGIRIIPVACSGTDKSTEFLMRSMALATNGTYAFLTDHSGVGGSHVKPTTDKYDVELLNTLLQRLISQFLYAKDCHVDEKAQMPVEIRQPENVYAVKLYPNPTNGRFTIESKKDIKEMFIADFTGKMLMRLGDADKKGRWQVDIGNYPSGVYLVKYITADNTWGAEKVVLLR